MTIVAMGCRACRGVKCGPGEVPCQVCKGKGVERQRVRLADAIPEDAALVTLLYNGWQRGALMNGGGMMDQPATYIDAMNELDREIARFRDEAP